MDTLLIIVTVLSLTMAAALAIVVAKLLRDERRRSDARVAALAEMSAEPLPPQNAVEVATPRRSAPIAPAPLRSLRVARIDDLELRPAAPAVPGVADLFSPPEQPSAWGPRFAVIAALGAAVLVVGVAVRWSHPAGAVTADIRRESPPAAAAAPLELLSLRHTQQEQSLVITGLVQNPRGSAPLSHVVATAFVFGPDGAFLSSARAPLDFSTLTPGDESPFVVTVPVTGPVARYRVGFRGEDGRVIAHVDKRMPEALVRK